MRGVLIILLLIAVAQVAHCRKTSRHEQEERETSRYYFDDQSCVQDEPDCEKCLSSSGNCEWCSDGSQRSECVKQGRGKCPSGRRKTTCEQQAAKDESKKTDMEFYDKSLDELDAMDAPFSNSSIVSSNASVVTFNASVFCERHGGCDNCTAYKFCFWCESTKECRVHYHATTTESSCPGREKAYYRQCLYPIGVKACPKRKSTCKDCLHKDGLCYWCSSTETCEFYPGGDFQPDDCPKDKWYSEKCPMVENLLWILLPILAIILIPVIIYLIIWLICCCMRAAGYEPLEPAQPPSKKHPKGIRLKPGSPSNKTGDLRKKYGLDNP